MKNPASFFSASMNPPFPVLVKRDPDPIEYDRAWNSKLALKLEHDLQHYNGQGDLEEVYACAWMPPDPGAEHRPPVLASVGKGGLWVWKREEADDGQFITTARHEVPAISCDWSDGGQYLAVGHKDGTVTIWHDAALSGNLQHFAKITLPDAKKEVISVSWKYVTEECELLICGTKDGVMAVLKVDRVKMAVYRFAWLKDPSNTPLQFVKWLPKSSSLEGDPLLFLYGGYNSLELVHCEVKDAGWKFIRITDMSGEKHNGSVLGISFSESQSSFITWGSDRKVKVWTILPRLILRTPEKDTDLLGDRPNKKMVNGVHWTGPPWTSPGDNYVAVAHEDRSVLLFVMGYHQPDEIFPDIFEVGSIIAHKRSVTSIRWYRGSPDKRLLLASASRDGTVKIWSVWKKAL